MRNRSSAVAITSNTKKRMTTELGLDDVNNLEEKADKISQFLEKKLKLESRQSNKTIKTDFHLEILPPQYLDIKKEYITKEEKVNLY
jgi:hypothetical protein